jgi:alanyl-tRNA synthetase
MKKITSLELRNMWREFFESKGHRTIGSASLIPENDPTVLFTTAGMHPLVPYLLGSPHPAGRRLSNVQKCVRTGDIDDVGDDTHCTFFEMLGNWSLGDYFKDDMIRWSFEFLTSPQYLGIPVSRLAVTVFEGDENAPRDTESAAIWKQCGIPENKIFYLGAKHNWWGPAGLTGPCGPDTEMFVDTEKPACGKGCDPSCRCGKYVEIWNDVFMQYFKDENGKFVQLKNKNVDTGMGLERTVCMLNGLKSVYDTDLFRPAMDCIERLKVKTIKEGGQPPDSQSTDRQSTDSQSTDSQSTDGSASKRIIADHIRTAVFMLGDERGVTPGNVDQGYVLRRLIRRAVRHARRLEIPSNGIIDVAKTYIEVYKDIYPELKANAEKILSELEKERERFERTLGLGLKEFDRLCKDLALTDVKIIAGAAAFRLYDTCGFPIEITVELAAERGLTVDTAGFEECFTEHKKKSQAGAEPKFKGGLGDTQAETTKLHTATHLLQAALRTVLGNEVFQRGSNITAERLRFDFSFHRKMEADEIQKVEQIVNGIIKQNLPVTMETMTVADAKKAGAIGLFEDKYDLEVKVYKIEGHSIEICGGPHAENTGCLGTFKIQKEESNSSGVRRIKAVLMLNAER